MGSRARRPQLVIGLCALLGCEGAEGAARDGLGRAASAAADKSRDLADQASSGAKSKLSELGDDASKYVDDKLRAVMAGAKDGTLEARIREGHTPALELVRIAKAVSGSVTSDTTILPIYRPATEIDTIDREIAGMPRTEVIDGVTVGFKRVRELDLSEKVDEDAYLVLWRRDDKIVGFVYQKKTRIDIDVLVEETPKLMRLFAL